MMMIKLTAVLLGLVLVSTAYAQEVDTSPKLIVSVIKDSQYAYRDAEGYTVAVGLVKNTDPQSSISNVHVRASFYDQSSSTPLETTVADILLDVIPPNGVSPYVVRSTNPDPDIKQTSVSLHGGFTVSQPKLKQIAIDVQTVFLDSQLRLSGTLQNDNAPMTNTKVHIITYDDFKPPKILNVETIDIGNVTVGEETPFEFTGKVNPRSLGVSIFAESDVYYSSMVDLDIGRSKTLSKVIQIYDLRVEDTDGNKISEIDVGSLVYIKSKAWLQFVDDEIPETQYMVYVQVKSTTSPPYIEFIDTYDGRFTDSDTQQQSFGWTPKNPGVYLIETFVWDRSGIPLGERGPIALISVN